MNRTLALVGAIIVLFGFVSPGDFYTNFATRTLVAAIFALSLNLLVGYGGLISLGHSAFFGISAYCVAWLTVKQGWGHLSAIAMALTLSIAVAGAYGALALRARGIGFLMITLALGQITWGLANRWVAVTGGDNGITGITRPTPFGISLGGALSFYLLSAVVFLLVCFLMSRLVRSPFGASLRGTRDQPRRMSALGYDVWLIRWIAFVAAGLVAAIAGILDVYYHKFISPHALSLFESAMVLLMVIVGGSSTLLGPVLGAAIVLIFAQVASAYVERWTAALGILFLVIVIFMPEGILPGLLQLWRNSRRTAAAKGGADRVEMREVP